MPVDLEARPLRSTAVGRSRRVKDFPAVDEEQLSSSGEYPLNLLHWSADPDEVCWNSRRQQSYWELMTFSPFLLERWFSAVRLDACVGFVTSYTLDVSGFHVCIWQDRYRGSPNTVVSKRGVYFCVERHGTHHGAQITDSKRWITKPNRVRFWIELAAYHPCSLEEELHLRI